MDNKKIQSILQDVLEEEIPSSQIKLWKNIKESLVARKDIQQGKKMKQSKSDNFPRTAFGLAVIVILLTVAFVSPQGRAFAQRIFQFFMVTNEKSFPIPTEQVFTFPDAPTLLPTQILPLEPVQVNIPMPSTTPDISCNTSASQVTYFCQIKATEEQAGFDAKEFPYDPKGMKFSNATFNPSTGEITMEFVTGGGYLYLRQGIADFPTWNVPWAKVPSDAVEQV